MVEFEPNTSEKIIPENWRTLVGDTPINPLSNISASVSTQTPAEDRSPNNEHYGLQHIDELQRQTVADMQANRGLREQYADKAYKLATGCITLWAVLLGTNGTVNAVLGRQIWSDSVIIAVTTGVTVSVLAAFLGVIRGLFPNPRVEKE